MRKPESVTRMIATQMFDGEAVQDAGDAHPQEADDQPLPSRRRSMYFAISRLPTTKPTDVRPSWRPYSNSVAFRMPIANGSSRTFHRPNEK